MHEKILTAGWCLECVLTYVAAEASTRLIAHLAARLHNAAFFVYEQCQPHDGFGRFMIDHFTKVMILAAWTLGRLNGLRH